MNTTPVLIAGGGPVGMTLALELAARGVASTVVERNPTTTRHPKMDITNARSMEIFRRLGLVPALRAAAVPPSHPFDVSWVTTMAGHELHRFRYPSVDETWKRIRASNDGTQPGEAPMRVSQVEIEPVLKRSIDALKQVDTLMLANSRAMAASLRSIDSQIGGVAAVLLELAEPRVRAGLSRAFARKFTAAQLTDMQAFFATPSGFQPVTRSTASGLQ